MNDRPQLASRPSFVRRDLTLRTLVGSALSVINRSDAHGDGSLAADHRWRVGLTYFVPLSVSPYVRVVAARGQE